MKCLHFYCLTAIPREIGAPEIRIYLVPGQAEEQVLEGSAVIRDEHYVGSFPKSTFSIEDGGRFA